jgi:2,4-dienoyl-CoA reductase-like NADH-dependent reductase (Old Yellow Enzyme family)
MTLRRRVELYLKRTDTTATAFGRVVLNDPRFVADLRAGRKLRATTAGRVKAWLDRRERGSRKRC